MRKSVLGDGTPSLVREYSVTIYASGEGWEVELYENSDLLSSEPVGTIEDLGHYVQARFEELIRDDQE